MPPSHTTIVATTAAIRPEVNGDSPELVKSVRLGTAPGAVVPAAVAGAATGTTVSALGVPSLATTSCWLSAAKLIASPCGEAGSATRTGSAAKAPTTSDPVSGHT